MAALSRAGAGFARACYLLFAAVILVLAATTIFVPLVIRLL